MASLVGGEALTYAAPASPDLAVPSAKRPITVAARDLANLGMHSIGDG